MKIQMVNWRGLGSGAALVLCSCAGARSLVITDPVGPAQLVRRTSANAGDLIVYSSWDRFDTLDAEHQKHTPYSVVSDPGAQVVRVRNRCGSFGGYPETVHLPAGRYRVEARSTNVGPIEIPVIIQEGQTTVVYLDGTTSPPEVERSEGNWIRQANGRIVGWRAAAGTP